MGMLQRSSVLAALLALIVAFSTTGCGLVRKEIDIRVPPVADPGASVVVALGEVTDARKFEPDPTEPSTPSVGTGPIDDATLTSTAVAQIRDGRSLVGDVFLDQGRTVSDVVRDVLVAALREKGYSVVPAGGDGIPLNAEIEQFWEWLTVGFWTGRVDFEIVVHLESPIVANGSRETVRTTLDLQTQTGGMRAVKSVIHKGLNEFKNQVKAQVKSP